MAAVKCPAKLLLLPIPAASNRLSLNPRRIQIPLPPSRCCLQIRAAAKSVLPLNPCCLQTAAAAKSLLPPSRCCLKIAAAGKSLLPPDSCAVAARAKSLPGPNPGLNQIQEEMNSVPCIVLRAYEECQMHLHGFIGNTHRCRNMYFTNSVTSKNVCSRYFQLCQNQKHRLIPRLPPIPPPLTPLNYSI